MRIFGSSLTGVAGLAVGLAMSVGVAHAQSDSVHDTPSALLVGFERTRLPGGEGMGLVGVQYLFESWSGWRLGPAAYGAATGRRGGLFTWGGELQYVGRPSPLWQWSTGVYAGGGGGAGAPVGGGLMLRPHVDLWWCQQGGWQLGLSASEVRFPSGAIRSPQLGLILAFDDRFSYTDSAQAGHRLDWEGRAGLGFDRVQAVTANYSFQAGSTGSMGYLGMRLDRLLGAPNPAWGGVQAVAGLEAAGAARGGADGYAEGLGTLGLELQLGTATLGARAALGLAGGGALPTRGGAIAKLAVNATVALGNPWFATAELGGMRTLRGSLRANYAQLGLGFWLDQGAQPSGLDPLPPGSRVTDSRWGLAFESYGRARRKDGSRRSMQTIGWRFDRALGDTVYFSGQAHSAVSGGAGAYSMGLVGLGAGLQALQGYRVGGEVLVGAAGGGGVAVKGGTVVRPITWVSRDLGAYNRVQLGLGWLHASRGDLSTPVMDLSWIVAFGLPERH